MASSGGPFSAARTLTVEGVEIQCSVAGTDRDDQDPIVLLHGIGETAADNCEFLLLMLARNYRVISIDLGASFLSGRATPQLDHLTRQVQGVIDQIVPGRRVGLFGFSTGGLVAAAFAASHSAVSSVVLVAGWLKISVRQRLFIETWQRLSTHGPVALGQFARFAALSSSFVEGTSLEALERFEPIRLSRFTDEQLVFLSAVDLTEIAPRIGVPTLVIGCAYDDIVPIEQTKALFGAIPGACYVEIDSGHAVVIERPAEVLSHVDTFFRAPARYPAGATLMSARP
jgi:pimeloyl-ACP methyl ester carboxylesterase